jgi:hypothetical protein
MVAMPSVTPIISKLAKGGVCKEHVDDACIELEGNDFNGITFWVIESKIVTGIFILAILFDGNGATKLLAKVGVPKTGLAGEISTSHVGSEISGSLSTVAEAVIPKVSAGANESVVITILAIPVLSVKALPLVGIIVIKFVLLINLNSTKLLGTARPLAFFKRTVAVIEEPATILRTLFAESE